MKGQNMTSRTMNFLCLICSQRNRNVRYLTLALVENSVDQSREFCALAVGRNVRSLTFKHSVEPGVSGRTVGDRNRTGNVRCLTSDCAAGTVRGCLAGLSKKKVSDVRYLTSVVFQKSTKRIHGRVRLERPVQEQHSFLLAGQEEGATTASCVGGKGCGFWNLRTSQSLRSAAPIRPLISQCETPMSRSYTCLCRKPAFSEPSRRCRLRSGSGCNDHNNLNDRIDRRLRIRFSRLTAPSLTATCRCHGKTRPLQPRLSANTSPAAEGVRGCQKVQQRMLDI